MASEDPLSQALRRAIKSAGGPRSLAKSLGVTRQAIEQWRWCPPTRVLEVERLSGIPRQQLRPDLYPEEVVA